MIPLDWRIQRAGGYLLALWKYTMMMINRRTLCGRHPFGGGNLPAFWNIRDARKVSELINDMRTQLRRR